MTLANTEQQKSTPWFAKAGAACSIVPISRFVSETIFALKGGGYGCLFSLTGIDEESLTDLELESRVRSIEGALRGLPEGSCLYQYMRVLSGFNLPRQRCYKNPVTEVFASDRLTHLDNTAGFRRIDLHWCLTLEPAKLKAFQQKPQENAYETSRMLAELEKSATLLEGHLSSSLGLRVLGKKEVFQFFSYLFNLEDWAERDQLRSDIGVDRQIVKSPVAWHKDHVQVGNRHVQMFSLQATPDASRPCLFSGFLTLDCDSVLCTSWRPKSTAAARHEIDAQEKFISFFKVGVLTRVMSGRDTASLETGAGARAANSNVDDLSEPLKIAQRIVRLDQVTAPAYMRWLAHENASGVNIYVAANPLRSGSRKRTKECIAGIRHLYLDIDHDGDARLAELRMSEAIPEPTIIVATSPGKYQVLWSVKDFNFECQELTLKQLAVAFGGDAACTDCNRVIRIPGFHNAKYSPAYPVTVEYIDASVSAPEDFRLADASSEAVLSLRGLMHQSPNRKHTHCPYWGPSEELRRRAEAKAIAASLYQPTTDKKGEFFTETPQKIFAHLLTFKPSPQELVEWMANPDEIDRRVQNTEMAMMIAKGAQQQRNGVLASLGLIADSLRMLPDADTAHGSWSATEWSEHREGWIFLTSKPSEREALRPLHSLWIDLLVLRLLNEPKESQHPVWFVLDELASLQRLPQLHTAITENRKSKNPLVLGFQGKAQLEMIYGHLAEVMLSQPTTKIFLRTTEPKAAEWVSNAIGKIEIERLRETHSTGLRAGNNFTVERQVEPLVLDSEISGLPDRHAFLKLGNHVSRFAFDYWNIPATQPAFVPRPLEEEDLAFEPKPLPKKAAKPAAVAAAHRQIAAEFGNQADAVVMEARARGQAQVHRPESSQQIAKQAVTYARDRSFEREAVTDERELYRDALRRGMSETTYPEVRAGFEARIASGEFQLVRGQKHDTGRQFTTAETLRAEKEILRRMQQGQGRAEQVMSIQAAVAHTEKHQHLNAGQRAAAEEILTSGDVVQGLEGRAGVGKTTLLRSVREAAETRGYVVEGFAPTSRAANQLRDAGISADTLQGFLVRARQPTTERHLYMVDESSLASTRQVRDFLAKLDSGDRVLLIGDTRQHQGVEAGKPFEQLVSAGMKTAQVDQIVRQREAPELLKAVEHLSRGEIAEGVALLEQQGRVTEIADPQQRIAAIARSYAASPENTIVVSPDNASRRQINQAVRSELQALGTVASEDHAMRVLAPRSDMTGADRTWAARYAVEDVLYYPRGSKDLGIERQSYTKVIATQPKDNLLTVQKEDGATIIYNPARLYGVNVYRELEREFAVGDRLGFTAPSKELGVANRDLGTVQHIGKDNQITVKMDNGKSVSFDANQMRHFDHGYAVTSHSSQGLTADRVLVNIDANTHPELINPRFAYVSVSRAARDAQIYTNATASLTARFSQAITKSSAIELAPGADLERSAWL